MMTSREFEKNKLNLWDGLTVTFIVQKYYCMFPLKRQGNQIVHSLFAVFYSIISVIAYYCLVILALYMLKTEVSSVHKEDDDFSKSYLIVVIAVFELVFNNLGILIVVIFANIKKTNHISFLQKLYDLDLVILGDLKTDINYHRLRLMCYSAYLIIFTYYIGLMAFILYKLYRLQYLTLGIFLMTLLYQFEQSATAIITWTYINYVMLMHDRFVLIRKRQEDLAKEKKMVLKSGNQFTENVSMLSTLLTTYKELCSCIEVLNDLSGSILILRVAHDFTLTTSQVYLISWIIMDNTDSDKYELVFAIFLWMFQNIVKLCLTTLMTEVTVEEAKTCSYIINKSNKNSNDEDVRCMLDSFDLWLLHRKIEFNANNFFRIDLSLLYAIIGALTSYVLILIQFKQQEEILTADSGRIGNSTVPN